MKVAEYLHNGLQLYLVALPALQAKHLTITLQGRSSSFLLAEAPFQVRSELGLAGRQLASAV